MGRLGRDPEIRVTTSGKTVGSFPLATNWLRRNEDGEDREVTEWHRVVVFGRTAEICGQFLRKGQPAFIEGKISTRKWEDKEGNTRYMTEVISRNVGLLGNGNSHHTMEYQQNNPNKENADIPF